MPEPRKHVKISDIKFTTEEEHLRPGVGARVTGTITINVCTEISDNEWHENRTMVNNLVKERINHQIMTAIYGDAAALACHAKKEVALCLIYPSGVPQLDRHPALLLLDRIIAMSSGYSEPPVVPNGLKIEDLSAELLTAVERAVPNAN